MSKAMKTGLRDDIAMLGQELRGIERQGEVSGGESRSE
jgi:hypothetical protein